MHDQSNRITILVFIVFQIKKEIDIRIMRRDCWKVFFSTKSEMQCQLPNTIIIIQIILLIIIQFIIRKKLPAAYLLLL